VIDIPGTNYFSPHPIPFLNSDQKVMDFVTKYKTVYCVLKRSSVADMGRLPKNLFNLTSLKDFGIEYLYKVEVITAQLICACVYIDTAQSNDYNIV